MTRGCLSQASGLQQVVGADGLHVDATEQHLQLEDAAARAALQQLAAACEATAASLRTASRTEAHASATALRNRAIAFDTETRHAMAAGVAQTVTRHCDDALRALRTPALPDVANGEHCTSVAAACDEILRAAQGADMGTIMQCGQLHQKLDLEAGTEKLLAAAQAIAADPQLKGLIDWEQVATGQEVTEQLFRSAIQFLCSTSRLCLLVSRLYGTLLKNGFCGTKDEEEEEGDGEGGRHRRFPAGHRDG